MSLIKHLKSLTSNAPLRLQAIPQAAWPWLVKEVAGGRQQGAGSKKQAPVLVVLPDPVLVDSTTASIAALCPNHAVLPFPVPDVSPYDRLSTAAPLQAQRLAVMEALQADQNAGEASSIIVTSIPALAWRLPYEIGGGGGP